MVLIGLLAMLVLLQVADIWTTWAVIRQGGRERNSRVRWFLKRFGVLKGLIVTKALGVGILVVLLWWCVPLLPSWASLFPHALLVILIVGYAVVVRRNYRIMQTGRS